MHRFIERHDPTRPLSPWLARITYNICLKRLSKSRQAARHEKGPGDGESTDESQESAELQMENKQRSQQVVSALNRLATQDRALLVMRRSRRECQGHAGGSVDRGWKRSSARVFW